MNAFEIKLVACPAAESLYAVVAGLADGLVWTLPRTQVNVHVKTSPTPGTLHVTTTLSGLRAEQALAAFLHASKIAAQPFGIKKLDFNGV